MQSALIRISFLALIVCTTFGFARDESSPLYFVKAPAKNKVERTRIANAGVAIDAVFSDSVAFLATEAELETLRGLKIPLEITRAPERQLEWGFPSGDAEFHDYAETVGVINAIVKKYPRVAKAFAIGKSTEGRLLAGIRISANPVVDSLPTAILVGCHHAREHLSVEIPLMIAGYLAEKYDSDRRIKQLLETREVWVVPMLNPDGAEYDIASGKYQYWRKNRRDNEDGTFGVDLNRNYAKGWGGPGSSGSTSSDTYRGPTSFSEPETQALRDFVRGRKKATVLLSFHTFSELVLWPWGHTYDQISNSTDRKVFETMGQTMAKWNGYKPMKSSGLYLASGDTTDWAYDELNLFAYTFELDPKSFFSGGFYPGAKAIQPTFKKNLEPALYLIEMSGNPYRALRGITDPLNILAE